MTIVKRKIELSLITSLGPLFSVEQYSKYSRNDIQTNPMKIFEQVGIIQDCISITAYYTLKNGYTVIVKKKDGTIDEGCRVLKRKLLMRNKMCKLESHLLSSIVLRDIQGRTGFEIVYGKDKLPSKLVPLDKSIKPKIDNSLFTYGYDVNGTEYQPNQILYFVRMNLDATTGTGLSALRGIEDPIMRKKDLETDLAEGAKRMWAPIGLFQMDTRNCRTEAEKKKAMNDFIDQIKPGRSIVTNKSVTGSVIDLKPDIQMIINGIEHAEMEILGHWGVPKALTSREKTTTKETLEWSVKVFYDTRIGWLQRDYANTLDEQWYPRLLTPDEAATYDVNHAWIPILSIDGDVLKALSYAVKNNTIDQKMFFKLLGWEQIYEDVVPIVTQPIPIGGVQNAI